MNRKVNSNGMDNQKKADLKRSKKSESRSKRKK